MIRLFADSTCDFTPQQAQELDIHTVPLTIHFGSQDYRDGIDMSHKEFYQKLRASDVLPTTSQVNPAQFEEAFAPYLAQGDDIVVLTISADLSATYQSAVTAAQKAPGRVHVVDTRCATYGAQLLLREAARLRDEGRLDAAQIAQQVGALAPRLRLYAVLDTLKYLKMGGRLSGGAAFIGAILGILPVVAVQEGKVVSIAKVRGDHAGMKALLELYQKDQPEARYGISFGHADDEQRLQKYLDFLTPHLGGAAIYRSSLGSVIGTHAGPGVVGIAYIASK